MLEMHDTTGTARALGSYRLLCSWGGAVTQENARVTCASGSMARGRLWTTPSKAPLHRVQVESASGQLSRDTHVHVRSFQAQVGRYSIPSRCHARRLAQRGKREQPRRDEGVICYTGPARAVPNRRMSDGVSITTGLPCGVCGGAGGEVVLL
jgi:hypothetical protein